MRFELMYESFFKIIQGIPLTLQVVIIATILGFILAILVALMRISGRGILSIPAYYFVYLIRGTPLLLQLYFVYYGLGQFSFIRESFLWPILREPYWCGIITLTISTGAYSSEIIRGGIMSVSKGYLEASNALGMSKFMTFMKVTLPITFRQALPAYGNELILMVLSLIHISEPTRRI